VRGGRLVRTDTGGRSQNEDTGKPALVPKIEKDGAPLDARRAHETPRPAPVTNREVAALERQSVPVARPSPQTEPTAPVPADQKPGEGASSSVLSACTAATIAGTYASSYGPIVCEPGGTGLECCYGGSCRKRLHLELAKDGRSLTGEWRYQNGQNGPAELDLTESCELTHGRAGAMRQTRQTNPGRWQGGNSCWEPRLIVWGGHLLGKRPPCRSRWDAVPRREQAQPTTEIGP
jgi:hypothetical protein